MSVRQLVLALGTACLLLAPVDAQRGAGPAGGGAPQAAKAAAPVDITGYWVSIVTEDWIERMSPDSPPSGTGGGGGGFGGGGGGGRGRGGAPAAAAPASTDPCRAYGAGGSMRVPGRLNITWADDNTLKVDMDSGTQTRLLHFGQTQAPAQRTLQGHSIAAWDTGARAGGGGRGGAAPAAPRWGQLRVVTTNTTGGYLLSSRNSYGENAVITEYFMPHQDFGVQYLTVVTSIEEGGNPRIVSSTFKKEPDGSKFKPAACEAVK
ncbi:MAG TPA: hypothetical protein VM846_12785 [Vicinamibacterales bacterium]|nr:hypothetical protein [Vicinamibacterales bacterium]